MFKGGFGDLLQQAQKMREEMKRIQESMANRTVEATAGGGMVKVLANGKQQIVKITLDPEVLKLNDKEMLEDLIRAGVNAALKSSQELMSEEMGKLAGGLGPMASMLKGFF